MSAHALLISGVASGQGKTTVTAALARKLTRTGRRVRVFKTGADFIDPLMLERACGRPVHVLDLWMVGESACRRLLARAAREAEVILVEGAMGLYDGDPSAADLARAFGLPVLLVLDVSAMAQTAGAIASGLRDYGPIELAGVVANQVAGPGHAAMLAVGLRDIPLVGTLPLQQVPLAERHLGLVLPAEVKELDAQLDVLADALVLHGKMWTDLGIRDSAGLGGAGASTARAPAAASLDDVDEEPPISRALAGKVVAIARDAAFAFIYPANVESLRALGASIQWFSPLADEPLPEVADAVILPGGYPELHGERLSGAARFHDSLRRAHAREVPILAECGGMMAATDALVDLDGRVWSMAGLLRGTTRMSRRLAGLGLHSWDTGSGVLRGHTFHYSTFETPLVASARTATHPASMAGEGIYVAGSLTGSYFHAYFGSCPQAIGALLGGRRGGTAR